MSHAAPATAASDSRRFPAATRARDAIVAHPRASAWSAIGLLLLVGVLVRLPQLGHRIAGNHSFWETQGAFTAREYARSGIDLFRTPLPVFGRDADVPFDLPVVQALASLLVQLGVDAATAMRLIGLVGFTATGALVGLLLLRWFGARAAVLAVGLLEFLPFGLHWGAGAFVGFVGVAFALLMVAGIDAGIRGSGLWLAVGAVAAVPAFLISPMTAPLYLLLAAASVWTAVADGGWRPIRTRVLLGAIGPIVGLGLAVAWVFAADAIKSAQPSTRFLTSAKLVGWAFGTPEERTDPGSYAAIAGRFADEIAGPAMVGLLVALILVIVMRDRRRRILLSGLLAVVVAGPLVFFHQYVADSFALIAVYPAAVAAMGVSIALLMRTPPVSSGRRLALVAIALVLLFVSTGLSPQGRQDLSQFRHEDPRPAAATLLLDATEPGDGIVMIGCDWDPTVLFNADRFGVMFRGSGAGDFWDDADIAEYPYLLSCDPALDPADFVPSGYFVQPSEDGLYRVLRTDV